MRDFARLFTRLDETTSTLAKVEAMKEYFEACTPRNVVWAIFFLSGRRFKRLLPGAELRRLALSLTSLPDWLFEECYSSVGDIAETLALILESPSRSSSTPLHLWIERIQALGDLDEEERARALGRYWSELETKELFLFNKLITGGFRVGVSQTLVVRALSEFARIERSVIAHRLMGHWEPTEAFYETLISPDEGETDHSRPYPFFLASPLDASVNELGALDRWLVEWKWDGIRAQLIRREGHVHLWSRGEDLITDRFPEIEDAAERLPDGVVLDGEILAWANPEHTGDIPDLEAELIKSAWVLPFSALQKRIGRKKLGPKILREVPVVFLAYDLLEHCGEDIRETPLEQRRSKLVKLIRDRHHRLKISPLMKEPSWDEIAVKRERARELGVEGCMIKEVSSPYRTGRRKGDWWKWKVDPFTIDAVMIYAQAGHGRRASLYTDYTFAVWNEDQLTPVAKAYSGLDQGEIEELDRWIRRHTKERFGPVRSVDPVHVFEIAFDDIQLSSRHKSGIALRFPRISRWRRDKRAQDADTLEQVKELLRSPPTAEGSP